MKKILFIAVLGMAGLVSAKETSNYKVQPKESYITNNVNFNNLNEFENTEVFLNFLKENRITFPELKNSQQKTVTFSKLNTVLYSYKIDDNRSILVAITKNNSISFSYVSSDNIKISYNNGEIVELKNNLFSTYDLVNPSIKCIRETAKKIKQIVEADDVAGSLCDLSPQCNSYIYAVAAAHCAANNNQPPK